MQKDPFRTVGVSLPPNLFFLKHRTDPKSSEPALVELRFQQARGPSGEISPAPSLEAAGVGEALELAPSSWVRTGSRWDRGAEERGGCSRSSQSARAPWRPDPGAGCQTAEGFRGPLPATPGDARTLNSFCQIQAQASGAHLAQPPQLLSHSRSVPRSGLACVPWERAAPFASAGARFLPFPRPGRLGRPAARAGPGVWGS